MNNGKKTVNNQKGIMNNFIISLVKVPEEEMTLDFLKKAKREFAREQKMSSVPSNIQLLRSYHTLVKEGIIEKNKHLEGVMKKRPIRSMSGIVSVQVLTKPFWCPGKCIFCPNDFTMPKSYINTEPGAMRALLNNFDPIKQVYNRLLSLTLTGHSTDKIEMIVLGGTWDVYPQDYKEQFIKGLYDACNTFPQYFESVILGEHETKASYYTATSSFSPDVPGVIEESLKINETAENRIIGLTVETRPEYVNDENCQFWRRLGVTRLEMGIQSTDDEVLKANKRGHNTQQSRDAVHTLRQYGFKFSVHLMPGLYQSTYEKDLKTFEDVYSDPYFKPDEIKFYPTSVIPNTELYELYREGKYEPLSTDVIKKIIRKTFLEVFPPYTRIKRLIRDIPSTEIVAGSNITNLSQLTHKELKQKLKDTPEVQQLYARLYDDYKMFDSIDEYVASGKTQPHVGIIGTEPDTQSYRNFVSIDTRSREIRQKYKKENGLPVMKKEEDNHANLVIRAYESSIGTEYFISFEDAKGFLYGFTRLCLPDDGKTVDFAGLGDGYAMIRELHVYGQLQSLTKKKTDDQRVSAQHRGFGSQLMEAAEKISQSHGYKKLSVISGIGVKGYYKKIGYSEEGTYMVKGLGS